MVTLRSFFYNGYRICSPRLFTGIFFNTHEVGRVFRVFKVFRERKVSSLITLITLITLRHPILKRVFLQSGQDKKSERSVALAQSIVTH